MPSDSALEQYRDYLGLLGRLQMDEQLAGKVDVSGVVQTTMLEAHQQAATWESLDDEARTAWLRRVFANNLLDEIRRFRAGLETYRASTLWNKRWNNRRRG